MGAEMLDSGAPTRTCVRLSIALIGWLVLSQPAGAWAQHDPMQTRASMQDIFQSLRVVMMLSIDREGFTDPANRERILGSLRRMVDAADSLDSHAKGFDPGRRYIGRSLAIDARRALRHFEWRDYGRAEFFIDQTANSCVSCHSRIESPGDSPLAADFFKTKELERLDPTERARLQVATRRFDDALETFEQIFESREWRPAELLDSLTQYLSVCVRVKHDLKRATKSLTAFAERADLWARLRTDVVTWIDGLTRLSESEVKISLASAKALMAEADEIAEYPSDRAALVHYLMATRVLNESIAATRDPGPDDAESYYLLGVAESRIRADFWRSPADFYLEQAIRLRPHSPVAHEAYEFLEEETILGYTGSAGTHIPGDVRERLNQLRLLAAPPPANSKGRPE